MYYNSAKHKLQNFRFLCELLLLIIFSVKIFYEKNVVSVRMTTIHSFDLKLRFVFSLCRLSTYLPNVRAVIVEDIRIN